MNHPTIHRSGFGTLLSILPKSLLPLAIFAAFQSSATVVLHTPRGAGLFVPAPVKTIRVGWSYPVNFETPDLVFRVYHTTNLSLSLRNWPWLTNIPGTSRSVTLPMNQSQEFFVVTASNYLGESDYASSR